MEIEKKLAGSDWATYQKLVRHVGGKFKLCTLLQKRLQQLYRSSVPGTDKSVERVLREVQGDAIGLRQIEEEDLDRLPGVREKDDASEK